MVDMTQIDGYLDQHLEESISELSRLCAQPSVAAQNWGVEECAALVVQMLEKRGFTTQLFQTGGSPVVFAEKKGKSNKTLLFYDHYDVQPPEPLELWLSPAFELTRRDGNLYARGVSDNKGPFVSRLFAIDALLAQEAELPCNIKFIVEGEEEISSVHLPDFVKNHRELLRADGCIWEFGSVNEHDVPMQYLGLRGICYVQFRVKTASSDVHSGLGGSIFPNAAWRLVWALNSLKGPDEHIRIPGFYDPVVPPSAHDRELMAAIPETAGYLKERYGIKHFLHGLEGGVELRLAEVFQPTCTICGLTSGYQGAGSKTVLPAEASAKVDFRLVPDQTPEQVFQQLRGYLDSLGFSDIEITLLGGEAPGRTDPEDPFVKLVVDSATPVYGVPMQVVPMTGGSGPNHIFIEHLGAPVCSQGCGYPGSGAHAPNEHIRINDYLRASKHVARIMDGMGS